MLGVLAKFLLVATAVAPISFVYAWLAYVEGFYFWAAGLVLTCCTLVAVCLFILTSARKHIERFPFSPTTVEAADSENTAFLLLYLSPLFTSSFASVNATVLIPTIFIFCVITATGYSYHFNPLLGLMKWHFYKVTSQEGVTYVLITKKHLRRANQICEVGQLTDYILLDLED